MSTGALLHDAILDSERNFGTFLNTSTPSAILKSEVDSESYETSHAWRPDSILDEIKVGHLGDIHGPLPYTRTTLFSDNQYLSSDSSITEVAIANRINDLEPPDHAIAADDVGKALRKGLLEADKVEIEKVRQQTIDLLQPKDHSIGGSISNALTSPFR